MAEPIVRLVGDIDEEVVSEVIEKLSRLSHNVGKVILLIDSDGGSLEEGFRLIDAIRILQNKQVTVRTVACGKIYSMGLFIYCAGNERTAYPSALSRARLIQPPTCACCSRRWNTMTA